MSNVLIHINFDGEQPTVSARDLHAGLGISERFQSWFNRQTINQCDDLKEFQKLVKLSDKYSHVEHEHCIPVQRVEGVRVKHTYYDYPKTQRYTYKSYRVFASN